MTQIGTFAFDAAKSPCQDTIVNLKGTPGKSFMDFLNNVSSVVDGAVKGEIDIKGSIEVIEGFTDGYSLEMTMTLGQQMLANSLAGICMVTVGKTKAAVCMQAKAGDEDGRLAANGIRARWIAAASYNEWGNPQTGDKLDSTSAWLDPKQQGLSVSPKASWLGTLQEDGTFSEPQAVVEALNKGEKFSARWFQPGSSKRYLNVPRYEKGDKVTAYANMLGADENSWNNSKECLTAKLSGAHTIAAGAAIAFGAAALF